MLPGALDALLGLGIIIVLLGAVVSVLVSACFGLLNVHARMLIHGIARYV